MLNNRNIKQLNKQSGFLNLPNDSMFKTLVVALVLCLVCSVIVSTAATVLKPKQQANKLLDKKKNILVVAGIEGEGKSIDELFEQIETRVVDMQSGEYTDAVDSTSYDQLKASKDPAFRVELDDDQDIAKIGGRAKYANVYLLKNDNQIEKIILPIKGYGLWSTMFGFLALESDASTVSGITFYEHGETPGLGGEIENNKWQASWHGKQIVDDLGEPILGLIKGRVDANSASSKYQIDGLAGATLTSTGVTNLIQFWVGEDGFGPYLEKLRKGEKVTTQADSLINRSIQTLTTTSQG